MFIEKLEEQLIKIKDDAQKLIENTSTKEELGAIKVEFLGKKGKLKGILKEIKHLDIEMQRTVGRLANEIKELINRSIGEKKKGLEYAAFKEEMEKEAMDLTVQGRDYNLGSHHPITQIIRDIARVFSNMGFRIVEGPELEDEYYNFETLNLPKDHPARNEQDSFYITKTKLLRTQTSPVQIRVMEKEKPPIAIVSPGRCFRRDATDTTHSHTFHQIEGLLVDKNVSFADLKGTLHLFARKVFGSDTKLRFSPDFFPFTEPSAEFAISCFNCGGNSNRECRVCRGSNWIEMGGCGLVDPAVFGFVGIDPEVYSGYAFGMGIERIAMVKYSIPDIRMFYENDYRFLRQF